MKKKLRKENSKKRYAARNHRKIEIDCKGNQERLIEREKGFNQTER